MEGSLNSLRDEIFTRFITKLRAPKASVEQQLAALGNEPTVLRLSIDEKKASLGTKFYDMLFLLLSLAYKYEVDLDEERKKGWIKKEKYLVT